MQIIHHGLINMPNFGIHLSWLFVECSAARYSLYVALESKTSLQVDRQDADASICRVRNCSSKLRLDTACLEADRLTACDMAHEHRAGMCKVRMASNARFHLTLRSDLHMHKSVHHMQKAFVIDNGPRLSHASADHISPASPCFRVTRKTSGILVQMVVACQVRQMTR